MREINKEMAIARIGNDIGITWSFFQTQPGVSWKVPYDLTGLDLSLTLFNPLTGEIAIHDFEVTDNSLHWVFKGKNQSKLGKYTLTMTVNKGQDNQHVVDRIEFLELVSRSNSGVIRQGCAHGDRSVLDTECIALGTVVDYGYETVAHAMMTYATKEDMEALMRNAYLTISRRSEGFFKVEYDVLDEKYARDYFEHRAPMPLAGGCSVIAHGGLVGRNMDWLKRHPDGNVDAVFEVHTSAAQGRYASFGFAGSLAELSAEKVESREYSDAYRLLPYYLQDGENEKGLMAAILVVPATSSRVSVPEVEKRDRVCSLALVRHILDHYQSVDEAVTSLRNYVEIFHPASLTTMGYEPHFFLKDSTKSVVLEFSGTGLVAIENNVCTNFHQHGVTFNPDGTVWTNTDVLDGHLPSSQGIENYGSGLERFNAMVTAAPESKEEMRELLDAILFSKSYILTEGVWNSEFVGGTITVDTPSDDPTLLARIAEYRQKYADDAPDIWITKQSVIYDLANFSASLTVFEGEEEYKAAMNQDENVATKEFVEQRVANFITRSVNDLVNYYLKSETYTRTEVQALIRAVQQFTYEVLPVLPDASASTMHKIYLVPSSGPKAQNVKDEFITVDNGLSAETRYTWEQIGSTTIDLSNYPTFVQMISAINAALADYVTTSALTLLLAGKQDALSPEQLAAVNSGVTSEDVAQIEANRKAIEDNEEIVSEALNNLNGRQTASEGKLTELEREVANKANKDGYYQTLTAGYADKAADLDIHTATMVHHTQVKPMDTTGGDKDVKDGNGYIRVVRGTESGITAAGAKIISLGFNLIPSGSGTTFTFRCVKGEWGAYGTTEKNNGYLFANSQGQILIPVSVKQNGVDVPTHADHGRTYYLPPQDGQCTVVFATSQTNPCAHLCWGNGRDEKDNYEAYNTSQVDLASAITAIGETLRRVGYVFDEINLETKQSIRRIGYRLLNALSWTMEAGPTPEEGEATNTFRAIVSGGVASSDTIKAGGAFAIKGLSGLTFSLDGTSLVCDSTIASVADFVAALGSGSVEYELAVQVVATNTLNGQITISDYGIIIFENTAGATVVDIDFDFDTKWIDFVKNLPNDLEQIVDGIERAHEDIDALRANRDNLGDVHAKSIDLDELPKVCHYEAIIKATTAPNVAPDFIGQMWIDTAAEKVYVATATTNSSSFKALN